MVEKILLLKADSKKLMEFKKNIQKLLENKFDWKVVLESLEKKYREIILEHKK